MNRLGKDVKGRPLKKLYSPMNIEDYVVVLTRRAENDDEGQLIKGVALKVDQLGFRSLFRYASFWNLLLTFFGIIFGIVSAVLLVILVYVLAILFRYVSEVHYNCVSKCYRGNKIGIAILILSGMLTASTFLFHFCSGVAGSRQLAKIRKAYFSAAMHKDFTWYDCYVDRGLPFRMISDITELRDGLGINLPKMVHAAVACLGMVSVSFWLHVKTTLICLFLFPLFPMANMLLARAENKLTQDDQKAYEASADTVATGILANIRLVKLFQTEEMELARFKAALPSPWRLWTSVLFGATMSGLVWFFPSSLLVAIYMFCVLYYEDLKATSNCKQGPWWLPLENPLFGRVHCILVCIIFFYHHLEELIYLIKQMTKVERIAAEAFFMIDWKSGINELSPNSNFEKEHVEGKLIMSNVYFAYPRRPEIFVLQGLHISIKPGQMVAIFGPNDSGKSTIVKLLQRLYDVRDGKIKLNGQNIKAYNVKWYRSQFGVFQRDLTLFNATIEENLRFCKLGATFDEIIAACGAADAHDEIVALPQGYQTQVGIQAAKTVSHALGKKIILAQILLRQSPILMLDGYISDLDQVFEQVVLSALKKLKEQKCTIIVTTDKVNSIVRACDTVFALKNGRVMESGAHGYLMKKKRRYYRMVEESLENTISRSKSNGCRLHIALIKTLKNYKFADAIRRIHEQHDEASRVDWAQFINDKSLLDSVFFRHVARKTPRMIQSRPIGCFTSFTSFSLETDSHYYDKTIRSNFLRERDFRRKLISLNQKSPYIDKDKQRKNSHGKQDNLLTESPSSLSVSFAPRLSGNSDFMPSSILRQSRKSLDSASELTVAPILNKLARSGDSRIRLIEVDDEEKLVDDLAKRKSKKIQFKESFLSLSSTHFSNIELEMVVNNAKLKDYFSSLSSVNTTLISDSMSSDELRSIKIIDDRLKHYFGWMVNSSIDNDSINSDESHTFWEEYNLQLQIAIGKKIKLFKNQIFPLTKYSWPFIIVAWFTSAGAVYSLSNLTHYFSVIQAVHIRLDYKAIESETKEYILWAAATSFIPFIQELILGFGSCWATQKLRVLLFKSYLYQSLEWYDATENDITFLGDSLATDTAAFQSVVLLSSITLTYFLVLIADMLIVVLNAKVVGQHPEFLYLILLLPWLVLARFISARFTRRIAHCLNVWLEKPKEIIFDCLTNIKTIIIFGLEEYFTDLFAHTYDRSLRCIAIVMAFRSFTLGLSSAAVFVGIGFWVFISHTFDNSDKSMVLYLYALNLIYVTIHPIGYGLAMLPDSIDFKTWVTRLAEGSQVLAQRRNSLKRLKTVDLLATQTAPTLLLQDVKFAHSSAPGLFVLNGVTMEIPSGKYVAIVGPDNSGKSSLVNILLNLYTPTKGSVLINNVDYKDLERKCLKRVIGCVDQDPIFMQHLSIAENLAYGRSNVTMAEMKAATKLACIDSIIEAFEHKYDTKLEELSETPETFVFRQRLAVARAAVDDPKILVVDDATVSVDSHNSALLHMSLMRLREGRTLIVASRRIKPILNADLIFVLRDGCVVEKGTDKELRALRGFYYELFVSQVLYETNEAHSHERDSLVSAY